MVQYYVATLVDNNIPGVSAVAQRSGRPLKTIRERLNGKGGRVRGNLMGKRVDFSARSVITPDPNISIQELGVPLKIAMNITKPLVVNPENRAFLTKLVQNGPKTYPGAKILERKEGQHISLQYIDRYSLKLNDGDIVHRHMMDGDYILFNRQPTLHRMSMMCHRAKIMKRGDTFRMNVADTKPYNADFDGDEMNLHMPQDPESEMELKHLAAVKYQLVSPANNKTIVGIFQDSLLGAYEFTNEKVRFSKKEAMNLLMNVKDVDMERVENYDDNVTPFNILSHITPNISLKYKTKLLDDKEDVATSNHVLEIKNGEVIRGRLEKGILGDGTKGILHRVCNDYGNGAAADYIDNLQAIITDFMKKNAYSVGVSDLIADSKTNTIITQKITEKKRDVHELIKQTHIGVFENNTGKPNKEEFETQINFILNQGASQAGKIGKTSLSSENRFVKMVKAGSKGSDLNLAQMISCLGQQNVDGKRIPYGFDDRTLPHFHKYDDTPNARGFVESSFIGGLHPEELFFHAMGGRVGLIDTAVKTSETGYIQRRLIKGCEDIRVEYDSTVRNNKGKIVQYIYGDDNVDPCTVEGFNFNLIKYTTHEIYEHYNIPFKTPEVIKEVFEKTTVTRMKRQEASFIKKNKEYIDMAIEKRNSIKTHICKGKNDTRVYMPIAFENIIANVKESLSITPHSLVNITPVELYEMAEECMQTLNTSHYYKPNELFKAAFSFYITPGNLLIKNRFTRDAVEILLAKIIHTYQKSLVAPGEMVGMIAAQSIGEPTTQLTLNTFHFAGVASKSNVTRGVPRIGEILTLSENPKNPSLTIHMKNQDATNLEKCSNIMSMIEYTTLKHLLRTIEIVYDPKDAGIVDEDDFVKKQFSEFERLMKECNEEEDDDEKLSHNWVIRMEMDPETMLEKNITMDDVNYTLKTAYADEITCIYSDYNSENLIFRLRVNISNKKKNKGFTLDNSDEIHILRNMQEQLMNNVIIRGVKNIKKVMIREDPNNVVKKDGEYIEQKRWVLDTDGSNLLDVLALDYIDSSRTYTNNIVEIYKTLGIEAARNSIFNELVDVLEEASYINFHHLSLLCDRMTNSWKMISIFRHGINNDNIGPIAKASFEETPEMFLKAARHGELDMMRGVSANVMCGQEAYFGTNAFNILVDLEKLSSLNIEATAKQQQEKDMIDELYGDLQDPNDMCNPANIVVSNNDDNIAGVFTGNDDDYELDI